MKTKIVLGLLGACAIILGGLGYYSNHKSVVGPSASWKTYTNPGYGFEIKYPDGDKVIDSNGRFTVTPVTMQKFEGGIGGVGITFNANSQNKSLDAACYLKESQSDPVVKNVRKVTFAGKEAVYSEDYASGQVAGYCFLQQGYIVNVSYDLGSAENVAILSTFKLTK